MGEGEPHIMTTTTLTGPAVDTHYWVTFPVASLPRFNWGDPSDSHRAVMSLFPHSLSVSARAFANILFRLDHINNQVTALIQSTTPPVDEALPPNARTLTLAGAQWDQPEGATVRFRVAVNPITRIRSKESLVPLPKMQSWIDSKLSGALSDITVLNHARSTQGTARGNRRPGQITIDTIDGTATINNTELLNHLRTNGVGRAKNYGAGLLTTQRIS